MARRPQRPAVSPDTKKPSGTKTDGFFARMARDAIAAGIAQGPEVGRVLNELLEGVLNEGPANERETLLKRL